MAIRVVFYIVFLPPSTPCWTILEVYRRSGPAMDWAWNGLALERIGSDLARGRGRQLAQAGWASPCFLLAALGVREWKETLKQ